MAYKIGWLIPNRVIEALLPSLCDEAFLKTLDADLNAMLSTASQPVSLLYDLRDVQQHPSAQAAFNLSYYKHPNMGRIITIGMTGNPILRFIGSLIGRSVGLQVKDFSSPQEARAYLASLEKM